MKKYKYIQVGIASPEEIRSWAYRKEDGFYGEVKKHETINYRTLKPERDGLFCEVIFGPTKDYQCACGKSRKSGSDTKICEKCHVEITESKVRREKMGFIALAAPVVHIWYRNVPSRIATLLDMKARDVDDIIYLASYIITDMEEEIEGLKVGMILSEQEHARYKRQYMFKYQAKTGAEAIKFLLQNLNLEELSKSIRQEIKIATKQKRKNLIKRLEIVEAFLQSGNKPEWMVMDVIPVIPPDLRPMVQLDGGRFATTDLNDLYRRIINRNTRLKKQFEQRAPELIVKNEKRMLQEAVDALFDNSKRNKKVVVDKNRPLKSLSDLLRGKQGRFRQNLLGKRVDYSGRSVIVVGPDLKMYQCGIPREMALILFKPFIINYLRKKDQLLNPETNTKSGIKKAKELIERGAPEAMEALEKIVVEHPVLLNRAPTLHRLSIQAFEPKLVEGKAIRLHPLVTTAFNADFDGDQMPVHVPLSEEAQAEARILMLASKNILLPRDGKPVVTPSQDMILGNYYLTIERSFPGKEGRAFKDISEVEMAYENDEITLQTRIVLPAKALGRPFAWLNPNDENYEKNLEHNEKVMRMYIVTTYGKIIFNTVFPKSFPYVNEATQENLTKATPLKFFIDPANLKNGKTIPEIIARMPLNEPFKKRFLSTIISEIFRKEKLAETSRALDQMKDLGFKYSTVAGITISAFDVDVLANKQDIIKKAEDNVKRYNYMFRRGLTTDQERKRNVLQEWTNARNEIEKEIKKVMSENATTNDIFMMADSGARGSASNFTQLAGMRGLMAKPNGEPMEIPIKSSFREGMSMSEFFISTHGGRKGSTDTALKTAEAGYLTRRLVDVSQDVTVTIDDCHTDKGMVVEDFVSLDGTVVEKLSERIIGRFTSKPVYGKNRELIIDKNQFITEEIAEKIVNAGIKQVEIRTVLTCDAHNGVCVKCYGSDLSTGEVVERGEVVGIVAAQSIGEPGTQLTMRTFHSGGVAGDDIVQGFPRIKLLFLAPKDPKFTELISEVNGRVKEINPKPDNRFQVIIESPIEGNNKEYLTDSGKKPVVKVGQEVKAGDLITADSELVHVLQLLRVTNVPNVERYILKEVQKVYRSQGVLISDKHIEIIIRQMLQKVMVLDEGDTDLLPGSLISKPKAYQAIKEMLEQNKRLPVLKPVLLSITQASLKSDSFLSAASFQETTRVLTATAIRGKIDTLDGLKENIIIGGLIPAGTGLVEKDDIDIESTTDEVYDIKP